ncbi:cytosine permease [Shewanella surugensis]|uniref:Cytosine permease n=1 Tax=Shewanella surugensis TaxID=212020 RepID=A0ABT0LCM9_9GAMM|nr:cytosine permease [Shewanella surugensis]MCL1125319.1 cytosine permease [Shewanella surugensis]
MDIKNQDYPLSEVPLSGRKTVLSLSWILMGFTLFTATMFAGGQVGVAFPFWPDLIVIIFVGNVLLGGYAALLANLAFHTGLNTQLLARFSFGHFGGAIVDLILGLTQIGWYAWGIAILAVYSLQMIGVTPDSALYSSYLHCIIVFFGIAFCITAYIGYRGLEVLSIVSVPLILFFIGVSLYNSYEASQNGALSVPEPITGVLSFGLAVTIIFGTFSSGATQSTNWTRFAPSPRAAIWSSLLAFLICNGLMTVVGAVGALVYGESDVVAVLLLQKLFWFGCLMLLMSLWTTQDNTIYNFSLAACHLFRTNNRRLMTLVGAMIGIVLALFRIDQHLLGFLLLLGTFIPPIGGVIIGDYFFVRKKRYPQMDQARFSKVNISGIAAYFIACFIAYFSPGIAPVNGIVAAIIGYSLFGRIFKRRVMGENNVPRS